MTGELPEVSDGTPGGSERDLFPVPVGVGDGISDV